MALTKVTRNLLSTGIDDQSNATAITIDSSENVGIGTTSPSESLTVAGHVDIVNTAININLMETGVTDSNHRIRQNAGNLVIQKLSDDKGTATDRFILDGGTGNCGIGTSSPTGKLEIAATGTNAAPHIKLTESGDTREFNIYNDGSGNGHLVLADTDDTPDTEIVLNDNGIITMHTVNTERMRIDASGNVGIGTTDAGNAKLVIAAGTNSGDLACIDFDGYGNYGTGASQSINFRMGRTGQATDQPAQIKSNFEGGGATASATSIGFIFKTISANTQVDQFQIDAAYERFKFNTTESPRSNNPQTNNCIVIGPSTSTAVSAGLTNATVLINRSGELYAVDSSHNNTQLTPHNWALISDGPSEELAWTYWSQRPDPDNPDQLQGINVDMAKVARKVEDLVGEKLVYTENSNMDDHTHQNIIADIQSTLANLTTRIEALEG